MHLKFQAKRGGGMIWLTMDVVGHGKAFRITRAIYRPADLVNLTGYFWRTVRDMHYALMLEIGRHRKAMV